MGKRLTRVFSSTTINTHYCELCVGYVIGIVADLTERKIRNDEFFVCEFCKKAIEN